MTHTEISNGKPVFTNALGKRVLVGAAIGLVLVSFFVIAAGNGSPSWSANWRVKPLLLTSFLGAIIGVCYDVTEPLRRMDGWAGRIFLVLSLIGYFIGLWLSLVLGLNGTMWN